MTTFHHESINAARTAQAELRQKLNDAIEELTPLVQSLSTRKRQATDHLGRLMNQAVPASEFPAVIEGWWERIAARGAEKLHAHINGKIANGKTHADGPTMPLSFSQAESVMSGDDCTAGTPIHMRLLSLPALPIPTDETGIDRDVLIFLLGDQGKAVVREMLEQRPISYVGTSGVSIGENIAKRREDIARAKQELQDITSELDAAAAELAQLQRDLRALPA